jgi:hypothetical protein
MYFQETGCTIEAARAAFLSIMVFVAGAPLEDRF